MFSIKAKKNMQSNCDFNFFVNCRLTGVQKLLIVLNLVVSGFFSSNSFTSTGKKRVCSEAFVSTLDYSLFPV